MPSRDLADLHPAIRTLAQQLLQSAAAAGIDVLITCTYRSSREQADLYAQGRTAQGPIVTRAKPGASLHNATDPAGKPAALAFDVVPLIHGKAVWTTTGPDHTLWHRLGAIGESLGLRWGGRFTHPDMPHFQLPGTPTLQPDHPT